jgi:hypothetical protein
VDLGLTDEDVDAALDAGVLEVPATTLGGAS